MQIIATSDGSNTLFHESLDETYHSVHGAMGESLHVYINNGLKRVSPNLNLINILEIGFGTGLNALLSIDHQAPDTNINYYSIEAFPLSEVLLNKLLSQPYDVIGLGGTFVNYNKDTYKASFFSTATAYVISNHYYPILLQNFKEGCQKLIQFYEPSRYALDRYWKQLQARHNWYIIMPPICIQRPSYSDIERRNVDYTSIFTNPEQQQKRNPLLKFLRKQ